MINVIIDSNIIISNYRLKYTAFSKFCMYFPERLINVYITKVSIEEIFKNYKNDYKEAISIFNKATKNINKIAPQSKDIVESESIEKDVISYKEYLLQQFKESKIEILPYPDVSHEEIIKYSVSGKKPFKEKDTGYKDFLIWHTALSLLKVSNRNLVIITKDSDFHTNKVVCQDFKDLVSSNGINPDRLEILTSINEFNQKYIDEIVEKVDLRKQLEKLEIAEEFVEKFRDEFEKRLEGMDLEIYEVNLPQEYENPSITYANYTDFDTIDDVEIYDAESFIINFVMRFDCEVEFYIFKSDYFLLLEEKNSFKVIDDDWNKHYIAAYESLNLEAEFSIIIDKDLNEIKQIDVNSIK